MRRNILIMTVVLGVAAALASLTFGGGLALFAALAGSSGVFAEAEQNGLLLVALALAAGVVAPALALLAAWHGWRGLKGEVSPPFRLPGWGWFLLALVVMLALGQVAFSGGVEAGAVVAHVIVAVLAALLMLAIPVGAARRHGWSVGRRAGATSIAWGGLGGVGLALVLELMLAIAVVIVALIAIAIINPQLAAQLGLGMPPVTPDSDAVEMFGPFLSSPLALLSGLLVIAVIVPLIEELTKSLAVPVVKWAGRPLTRLDAFLLGAACGAGFTLIEGITNGAMALAQPQGWATAMTARSGVAVIHVLASALAGLGWHAALVERNWRRGIALILGAVTLHGVWNGGALIVAWLGLRSAGRSATLDAIAGNLVAFVIVAGMGLVFLASLIALWALPGRLAGRDAQVAPVMPDGAPTPNAGHE
jgi:hypothetical protein